ncbi:hypothetical protein PtA15_1A620 [Puccinia triticina]|uniref:Uncharacterized protein n=1 Tax=Puccinia triticina TaxID=208348 RepID=A0ABY7C7Y1_9BASI|nr:uncharacterized protein PtA15_1A620 [Puccinia triticina]WAQ81280.1 hypothetical protein PtA15_1A620 [Puccinia triticina]WAR52172.1 hypothetical protein PtB15_1B611 [Puccinia triticina]
MESLDAPPTRQAKLQHRTPPSLDPHRGSVIRATVSLPERPRAETGASTTPGDVTPQHVRSRKREDGLLQRRSPFIPRTAGAEVRRRPRPSVWRHEVMPAGRSMGKRWGPRAR